MTHLLTHGVQDGGCRYTVGIQSCTMCLYGERGVSRMADVIVILRIICAFVFGLSLGYRIGKE